MNDRRTLCWIAPFLLGALASCQDASHARRSDVIATVDGVEVTVADWSEHVAHRRPDHVRPLDAQTKKELLDELILNELLHQEAEERGYGRHPRVKALMAGLFRADAVSSGTSAEILGETALVTEDEIRRYFEAHRAELATPEKVRARRILIASGEDSGAARSRAEAVRAKAVAAPTEFGRLALEHSDGPERRRQGEMGYLAAGGRPGVDPRLVEAALALDEGEISPVFETDEGWNVLQVVSRSAPGDFGSDAVRRAIASRLDRMRREEAFESYAATLREQARAVVDETAIPD